MEGNMWEALLGQLNTRGSMDVYYIKEKKTRIRLVLQPGQDPMQFYAMTQKSYQGKVGVAFLVFALVLQTSKSGDDSVSDTKVRAVRLSKTALTALVTQLAEGHELFDPKEGHALMVQKIEGETTSYTVTVSPKPVPVDMAKLEWSKDSEDEMRSLQDIADTEGTRAIERDQKKMGGGAARGPSGPAKQMSLGSDDEDEIPF
jgi:hypothetical protein